MSFKSLPTFGSSGAPGVVSAYYGISAPSFSPANLPSLKLWMDASDADTIVLSGSDVTTWTDKSSNAYAWTGTGAGGTKPLIALARQNGLNAIQFGSGGQARYFTGPVAAMVASTQAQTIIMACEVSNVPGQYPSPFTFKSTGAKAIATIDNAGSQQRIDFGNITSGSPQWTNFHVPTPRATPFQISWVYNGSGATTVSNYAAQVNGADVTETFAAQGDCGNDNIIGANSGGSYWFTGYIFEIIICNAALSAGDLSDTQTYLAAKWGL